MTSLSQRITSLATRIGQEIKSVWAAVNGKEPSFSKNTGFNKNFGTAAGTVCEGNDSRLGGAILLYIEGGNASSTYIISQNIDGGAA